MRRSTFFSTQRYLSYIQKQARTISQNQFCGNMRVRRHLPYDAMCTLASFVYIQTAVRHCTTKVPHFNYYTEIIRSIPKEERGTILRELNSSTEIQERAEKLLHELSENTLIWPDLAESRTLFLAALKNLKENKITVGQFASIHTLDSAIQTLRTQPIMHLIYDDELPQQMQQLPIKCFFNFNKIEWDFFCNQMQKAPQSEQFYHVLIIPTVGYWSNIVYTIQKILKCMQVLDWHRKAIDGEFLENAMLVPSFTMFQSALNAKAYALNRKPIRLIPTYGLIEPAHYAALKTSGNLAMTMYLPESSPHLRYKDLAGRFRNTIDGYSMETAFSGVIHDIYHAMRELAMSENVAQARMRLAEIARNHPKNKLNSKSRPVDDILIDGELIYSYSLDQDTMFNPNSRPDQPQSFGMIFYTRGLESTLHPDLKYAFIEDMVKNKDMWAERYQLGRNDLIKKDRIIYDSLVKKHFPLSSSRLFSLFNQTGITHGKKLAGTKACLQPVDDTPVIVRP